MLDQHFMQNQEILDLIISLADIQKSDIVLEIGCGHGELTRKIPQCNLTVVELDKKLCRQTKIELQEFGPDHTKLKFINANVIQILSDLEFNKLISNLPYSICEPLIQDLMKRKDFFAVLTVPKLFAVKIAGQWEKDPTKLTYYASNLLDVTIEKEIDKEDFYPVAKTKSVVITVKPKQDLTDEQKIIQELYLQSDKRLKNALRELLVRLRGLTKREAREKIFELGIVQLDKLVDHLSYKEIFEIVGLIVKP